MGVKTISFRQYRVIVFISVAAVVLAFCAFGVNYYHQFHGVFYNPTRLLTFCSTIFLVVMGVRVLLNMPTDFCVCFLELAIFYSMLLVITLATNAVQLTPFSPIDLQIVAFEKRLGISLLDMLLWAKKYPLFVTILNYAYASLAYQIALLPILAIFLRLHAEFYEYIFLMLVTMLLGFSFYYFFPTTAPASVFVKEYFQESQIATGLKFWQIHYHLVPETNAGGLIALPSFHVIWAWLGTYLFRNTQKIMLFLVPVNFLLGISCVLLGWHYLTDIFGSILILGLAHSFFIMHRSAAKWRETSCEYHAAVEKI